MEIRVHLDAAAYRQFCGYALIGNLSQEGLVNEAVADHLDALAHVERTEAVLLLDDGLMERLKAAAESMGRSWEAILEAALNEQVAKLKAGPVGPNNLKAEEALTVALAQARRECECVHCGHVWRKRSQRSPRCPNPVCHRADWDVRDQWECAECGEWKPDRERVGFLCKGCEANMEGAPE
ncbi:MAG TPA: hypothetical protein VMV15_14730 [Candidatus Binataceae bacterium]|nr:hypothetical protein [Candidatus Binataceae bacterium]